jgi:ribosomal protein L11 methyltransferase
LLDYGCGSGILAIAAARLGAARVVGVDIDEQAVASTGYNATANQVEVTAMLPDDLSDGLFDVVMANILSNPLKWPVPLRHGSHSRSTRHLLVGCVWPDSALRSSHEFGDTMPQMRQ